MTTVAIVRENTETGDEARYHAVANAGAAQSTGKTPGEALDAITLKLGDEDAGTLVIVQQMRPDRFFTQSQIQRLQQLSDLARAASLSPEEQIEMQSLVEAEFTASAQRTAQLADLLGR